MNNEAVSVENVGQSGFLNQVILMIQKAVRKNLIPGIAIQILALVLVGSYYLSPGVTAFWNNIADFKSGSGLVFAMISTAIFGGLIPFLYMLLTGRSGRKQLGANLAFVILYWAYRGGEVELFYQLQAWMFGDECSIPVIIKKVAVDQFVYNPIWATHIVIIGLTWQRCRFSLKTTIAVLRQNYWSVHFMAMMLSTWLVWIPAVSIIYCLPQSLQVPLFNLILCFFVLLATALKPK